jgi:hypothetical protein
MGTSRYRDLNYVSKKGRGQVQSLAFFCNPPLTVLAQHGQAA